MSYISRRSAAIRTSRHPKTRTAPAAAILIWVLPLKMQPSVHPPTWTDRLAPPFGIYTPQARHLSPRFRHLRPRSRARRPRKSGMKPPKIGHLARSGPPSGWPPGTVRLGRLLEKMPVRFGVRLTRDRTLCCLAGGSSRLELARGRPNARCYPMRPSFPPSG